MTLRVFFSPFLHSFCRPRRGRYADGGAVHIEFGFCCDFVDPGPCPGVVPGREIVWDGEGVGVWVLTGLQVASYICLWTTALDRLDDFPCRVRSGSMSLSHYIHYTSEMFKFNAKSSTFLLFAKLCKVKRLLKIFFLCFTHEQIGNFHHRGQTIQRRKLSARLQSRSL